MRRVSGLAFFVVVVFLQTFSAFADKPANYLSQIQVDLTKLLPPPPAPGSSVQKHDEQLVLLAQTQRTAKQVKRSLADEDTSVFRFADVLGPEFKKEKMPRVFILFDNILDTLDHPITRLKERWPRPRPFVTNKRIHPIAGLEERLLKRDVHALTHSYPSGHAIFGQIYAILLATMVPERGPALFERGREFGESRILGGVHFPSDAETGRLAGTVFSYAMMSNPHFQQDLTSAKAELRAALGLTANAKVSTPPAVKK